MAMIDDPSTWILLLFAKEEREGRGASCERFEKGTRPEGIPLVDGEAVFGIYKRKYFFTPNALIVSDGVKFERIEWADVTACSSRHGEGKTYSDIIMRNGRTVRIRLADMATGWSGRISQLYHQMIERYGRNVASGRPLMSVAEFFDQPDADLAPNLEPHPGSSALKAKLDTVNHGADGTRLFVKLVDDEREGMTADGVLIVTPRPMSDFEEFAKALGADGVIPAERSLVSRIGQMPTGFAAWLIVWD